MWSMSVWVGGHMGVGGVYECVFVVYISVWMGVINMFVYACLV